MQWVRSFAILGSEGSLAAQDGSAVRLRRHAPEHSNPTAVIVNPRSLQSFDLQIDVSDTANIYMLVVRDFYIFNLVQLTQLRR